MKRRFHNTHPAPAIPVRVTFPPNVIACPDCGLHHIVKGQRIWAFRCAQARAAA